MLYWIFETNKLILRMENKQQTFTIDTPFKRPFYFEDFQKVEIEEMDDYSSHHWKKGRRETG